MIIINIDINIDRTSTKGVRRLPALAKRRVGSFSGTTGLERQLTCFFPSKNLVKVSLTLLAGHSSSACPMVTAALAAVHRDGVDEWKKRMREDIGDGNRSSCGGGREGIMAMAAAAALLPDATVRQTMKPSHQAKFVFVLLASLTRSASTVLSYEHQHPLAKPAQPNPDKAGPYLPGPNRPSPGNDGI